MMHAERRAVVIISSHMYSKCIYNKYIYVYVYQSRIHLQYLGSYYNQSIMPKVSLHATQPRDRQ
jgi:hypothetical protein